MKDPILIISFLHSIAAVWCWLAFCSSLSKACRRREALGCPVCMWKDGWRITLLVCRESAKTGSVTLHKSRLIDQTPAFKFLLARLGQASESNFRFVWDRWSTETLKAGHIQI